MTDLDALTIADVVALQTAEEHGHEVVYPSPGSLLDQLGDALRENDRLRHQVDVEQEARQGWRDIAQACQAGTITVTGEHIESWLESLRSGNDVIFGHAEAHGLADHIAAAYDVIRRLRDGWRPGKNMAVVMAGSPRPDPVPIWMSPDHRRDSEPMTDAERVLLDAVAGPDDPPKDKPWPGEVFPDRGRWAFRCGIDGCEMNGTGYATREDAERRLRIHGATETCPYAYERVAGADDTEENP